MISEEHIPPRSDSLSDLHDVCRASVRIVYISRRGKILGKTFDYFAANNIEPINSMVNRLYVMIIDWKEYWEDI